MATLQELHFDRDRLRAVRELVRRQAERAGFDAARVADLVLAAHELAANSVRHAGGDGKVRVWRESGELLCEVEDDGRAAKMLAGRERPKLDRGNGLGLWLVSNLCDLVEIRSSPTGSVARLHMSVE